MAAVVEPVLSREKLRALLNEGGEQSCLDFKTTSDLAVTYDVVALVMEIAVMLTTSSVATSSSAHTTTAPGSGPDGLPS